MKRNIIITGGELFNKGAQAMTFITVCELKKRYPDYEIYLLSEIDNKRPNNEKKQYTFKFTGWYPIKFAKAQRNPLLKILCLLRSKAEYIDCINLYRNTDLMIDISGYGLGTVFGPNQNKLYLDNLEFAKSFHIPMYVMPQSFGPFDYDKFPKLKDFDLRCARLLPTVNRIACREDAGRKLLYEKYGLMNLTMGTDIVLNNKGIKKEYIYCQSIEKLLPEMKSPSVIVVPNTKCLDYMTKKQSIDFYLACINNILELGYYVYIISHSEMDLPHCREIAKSFESNLDVTLLEEDYSCIEFNEIIKHASFLVGSRFHAIVHAYKNCVPCIALGWSQKYYELLKSFGQERYALDASKIDDTDIKSLLFEIDKRKFIEKRIIEQHLSKFQQDNVFDVLPKKLK